VLRHSVAVKAEAAGYTASGDLNVMPVVSNFLGNRYLYFRVTKTLLQATQITRNLLWKCRLVVCVIIAIHFFLYFAALLFR